MIYPIVNKVYLRILRNGDIDQKTSKNTALHENVDMFLFMPIISVFVTVSSIFKQHCVLQTCSNVQMNLPQNHTLHRDCFHPRSRQY